MMSKSRASRSKVKTDPDFSGAQTAKVASLRKVFFISEELLRSTKTTEGEQDETKTLNLERFYHPGKNATALFITQPDAKVIMEVLEFGEPRRSWLINNDVSSNGCIYITTPIDVTLLALHPLIKHCSQRALALDSIHDEEDSSVARLLMIFTRPEWLSSVADVKRSGDMIFYKYNAEKTMAWLAIKVRKIAKALKCHGVHCGHSAVSQNYTRSEKAAEEPTDDGDESQMMDYIRMACDYVGDYIDLDLHDKLIRYLEIPKETIQLKDNDTTKGKRKSQQTLNDGGNKRMKLEHDGALSKLKNSSLLDESLDDDQKSSPTIVMPKVTPLKERVPTAKDKAMAKGAKGTKSIASFFKK